MTMRLVNNAKLISVSCHMFNSSIMCVRRTTSARSARGARRAASTWRARWSARSATPTTRNASHARAASPYPLLSKDFSIDEIFLAHFDVDVFVDHYIEPAQVIRLLVFVAAMYKFNNLQCNDEKSFEVMFRLTYVIWKIIGLQMACSIFIRNY